VLNTAESAATSPQRRSPRITDCIRPPEWRSRPAGRGDGPRRAAAWRPRARSGRRRTGQRVRRPAGWARGQQERDRTVARDRLSLWCSQRGARGSRTSARPPCWAVSKGS